MDIEKLIETLRQRGVAYVRAYGRYCSICDEVVTALSSLQAENEKLRAEADGMRSNWYKAVEEIKKLRAELEQVKRELDTAIESIPHECKTCLYHTVFFNGCTPDHDCTNPDGGCSNNYNRWEWRGQKKD